MSRNAPLVFSVTHLLQLPSTTLEKCHEWANNQPLLACVAQFLQNPRVQINFAWQVERPHLSTVLILVMS